MLYRLVPTLIEQGYVYIAESPLYEITHRDKSYFAFDESEKAAILKKLEGKKVLIQRSKGLGENEADMRWETTMNPETRRLIRITPDEAQATSEMFDLLLGCNLSGLQGVYRGERGAVFGAGGYFVTKGEQGVVMGRFPPDGWAARGRGHGCCNAPYNGGGGRMAGGLLQSACAVFRAAFSDAFRPRICKSVRVRWANVYEEGHTRLGNG